VAAEIRLAGSARFTSTMAGAAKDMADMPGFAEAGTIAAQSGRTLAPRRTGALAASITGGRGRRKNSAQLTSPLTYAGPVHWGVPSHNMEPTLFLIRGAEVSEAQWTGALERDAQRICDRVKGI
jgi:hypothetical protein